MSALLWLSCLRMSSRVAESSNTSTCNCGVDGKLGVGSLQCTRPLLSLRPHNARSNYSSFPSRRHSAFARARAHAHLIAPAQTPTLCSGDSVVDAPHTECVVHIRVNSILLPCQQIHSLFSKQTPLWLHSTLNSPHRCLSRRIDIAGSIADD